MRTIFNQDWKNPGRSIVLASRSPRRSALLRQMGFSFETDDPMVGNEEEYLDVKNLDRSVRQLALAKARSVSAKYPQALVLGADTIVVYKGEVFGKPSGEARASEMITALSGTSHTVISGVALVCEACGFKRTGAEKTSVYFRKLTRREIAEYIATNEYSDKAGAYGIQGRAMVFVDKIDGCYYNVVGLPVARTISLFNAYMTRNESDNV
jgi:septum formation protein